MDRRSYAAVVRAFRAEAEAAFSFLVDEFSLAGPERDNFMMPSVSYHGPAYGYEVVLDMHEVCVTTRAWILRDGERVVAALEALVTASGLDVGQHVFSSAQTVASLRRALADQGAWLRRLHPLLTGAGGDALIRLSGRGFGSRPEPPGE